MGSHARPPRRRITAFIAALVLLLALGSIAATRLHSRQAAAANSVASGSDADAPASSASSAAPSAIPSAASSSAPSSAAVAVSAAEAAHAALSTAVEQIASGYSAGSISVAALNTVTGANYEYGATSGMLTGSIVKLYILETLLIQQQGTGGLTSSQQATATAMIENSDNDAAETLFEDAGGRTGLLAANSALHLTITVPGPSDYWGLTQTSATDYIALLGNLVNTTSPLTASSQAYILGLMRNVESDQRWGVGVTADANTVFANKNGWLGVDDDNGLWLVNSVGVVTIGGQQVLMAVLTQHNSGFQTGINLVQSLASALAPLVAG